MVGGDFLERAATRRHAGVHWGVGVEHLPAAQVLVQVPVGTQQQGVGHGVVGNLQTRVQFDVGVHGFAVHLMVAGVFKR